MIGRVHSVMPRKLHDMAHAVARPIANAITPRVELPAVQKVSPDIMQGPHRELVITNAGASFWAHQALREENRTSLESHFALAL